MDRLPLRKNREFERTSRKEAPALPFVQSKG
jgi:hypothetical protein